MTQTPILVLSYFDKIFEVDSDAFKVGIEGVLDEEGQLITYFSEKLNRSQQNYSTYEVEFYAIV